jgi:tetratricopeptide (TPR) repeat protein
MEQTANPGTILLTADALRLAEGFVQVQPLGPTPVRGLKAPIEVYELTGASPVRTRLQAAAARGLTTFVGRDPEMDTLFTALEQAKAGKGQLVAVVGEPGVGKSRLFWEFTHSHRSQGCLVLETTTVSYGKATTYLPVINLLKGYFQIEPHDDARKIREKVTGKLFSLDRTLERCLAPLLWLLDVPAEDPEWERLDPPLRRQRLLESLRQLILRESQVQPLVLVFEDLHWIDGETQAVLDQLVESLPTARLLLLVNYRPEFRHGWGSKTYYRQVRIDPLSPASAEQLLGILLGADPSVAALKPLLIARTEGNPFFLEESVRSLLETGTLAGQRGAYRLLKPAEALQIPATAQVILAARVDRLSPEDKRLLQTAAVIGKDVPYRLLYAIADLDEPTLRSALTRLQGAEFLYEIQLFPDAEYTFKHALTHEVAYGSLLSDRRRTLHARLVDSIERIYAARLDGQMEWLAEHARRSELWEKAVIYAQQAGARAVARSAYRQAAALFEMALDAAAHLRPSRETHALSIDLLLALRGVFVALGEPDRSLDAAQRAFTLAEALGNRERLTTAIINLVAARYIAGDAAGAAALEERVLALVDISGHGAQQVAVCLHLGQVYFALGDYKRAIALLERNRERPGENATNAQTIVVVLSDAFLALSLAEVGKFRQALAIAQDAAHVAQGFETNTVFARLCALFGLSLPAILPGDHETAIPQLEEGLALAREATMYGFLPAFGSLLGYAYARTGRLAEGLGLLKEAVAQGEIRIRLGRARWLGLQSEALLLAGQVGDARSSAQRGLEGARVRGERGEEAVCLRALGEAETSGDPADTEAARTHLQEATVLATELGMRPLVAHCHLGLGKLYRRTGTREHALAHLTTAMKMYREMGMTYWLEQAERHLATSG